MPDLLSAGRAIDISLFNLINREWANPFFNFIMPYVTEVGSGKLLFVAALIVLLFKKRKKMAGIMLFAGLTVSYYMVDFLKGHFARPRPFAMIADVHLLITADNFSFPSGHATLVFMAAAIMTKFFGRYLTFFSIASLVGFSRVYLGAHYVSDVAAGALLGLIIGYGITSIAESAQSAVGF